MPNQIQRSLHDSEGVDWSIDEWNGNSLFHINILTFWYRWALWNISFSTLWPPTNSVVIEPEDSMILIPKPTTGHYSVPVPATSHPISIRYIILLSSYFSLDFLRGFPTKILYSFLVSSYHLSNQFIPSPRFHYPNNTTWPVYTRKSLM